jgi:hypothetical protein
LPITHISPPFSHTEEGKEEILTASKRRGGIEEGGERKRDYYFASI